MRAALILALAVLWATPAAAQQMEDMPGMPAAPKPAPAAIADAPANAPPVTARETDPPPSPADFAAERFYDPATMARARAVLRAEHGGMVTSKIMTNLFEYQGRSGGDGYRWDAEAWFGGDIDRLVVKTEGEGAFRRGVDAAEVQALWSRAIARYTDLQVGVRQDFAPGPARTYATLGAATILPYWIEANGAIFVSDKGEVLGRLEGLYDLRFTQRLILQPRAELNFAAQDAPETRIGSGLSKAELGLRLRYEVHRAFAPYVGVSYERSLAKTADYARAAGRDVDDVSFVAGLRAWF